MNDSLYEMGLGSSEGQGEVIAHKNLKSPGGQKLCDLADLESTRYWERHGGTPNQIWGHQGRLPREEMSKRASDNNNSQRWSEQVRKKFLTKGTAGVLLDGHFLCLFPNRGPRIVLDF